jgi:hypothetical protein
MVVFRIQRGISDGFSICPLSKRMEFPVESSWYDKRDLLRDDPQTHTVYAVNFDGCAGDFAVDMIVKRLVRAYFSLFHLVPFNERF